MTMESISTPQVADQYHDPDANLNDSHENTEETQANLEEPVNSSPNPGVVIKTEDRRHNGHIIGDTLVSVENMPKVKLEISSGPNPPVQNFKPLPYGRRKRNWSGPFVKLVLSAKRIHLPTKSNNILLDSLSENQGTQDEQPLPKYRRKQRNNVSYEEVPLSLTPKESILDAFAEAYDDNDDGFTTIKDLAEREITKMEPLDYDDYYDYTGFDDDHDDNVKNETFEDVENVKEEPLDYPDFQDFDEDEKLSLRKKPKKTGKPK